MSMEQLILEERDLAARNAPIIDGTERSLDVLPTFVETVRSFLAATLHKAVECDQLGAEIYKLGP